MLRCHNNNLNFVDAIFPFTFEEALLRYQNVVVFQRLRSFQEDSL